MKTQETKSCPTMTSPTNSRSQVAACLEAIEAEQIAARRALHSPAFVAKHQFITARMESMGMHTERLVELVGDRDEAMVMMLQAMQQGSEEGRDATK